LIFFALGPPYAQILDPPLHGAPSHQTGDSPSLASALDSTKMQVIFSKTKYLPFLLIKQGKRSK
jgi:hypothetical protein